MSAYTAIIITTVVIALPIWGYAVYNQWSRKPGARKRMLKACGLFAIIVVAGMIGAAATMGL